jgi:hypothetical protein
VESRQDGARQESDDAREEQAKEGGFRGAHDYSDLANLAERSRFSREGAASVVALAPVADAPSPAASACKAPHPEVRLQVPAQPPARARARQETDRATHRCALASRYSSVSSADIFSAKAAATS